MKILSVAAMLALSLTAPLGAIAKTIGIGARLSPNLPTIGFSLGWGRIAAGDGRGTVFRFGTSGLVSIEPLLEEFDGGGEVVAEFDEQIDVVEVSATAEAVGEVVTRIDGGAQFAAARAEEAEVAFEVFGRGRGVAEVSDGDVHGEMVAEAA